MHKRGKSNTQFDAAIEQRLTQIVGVVVELFQPDKIVLFGSYARGEHSDESTVDLLIIAKTSLGFLQRIKKVISMTKGEPPVEPLVYTPEEFKLLQDQGEGFIQNAIEEGMVLYEKNKGFGDHLKKT